MFAIYYYGQYSDCVSYVLNEKENTTLRYFIFWEKVLDKNFLQKQTSSKKFVETPPIYLFLCLSYVPFCVLSLIH